MSTAANRRLLKDIKKLETDPPVGFQAVPNPQNIKVWDAVIFGADDTLWEGGVFRLQLEFTDDYPNKPPEVWFRTPMFHPNIYNDGKICLDILQKAWTQMYDVYAIMTSIRSLLTDPNPDSPANNEAAKLFKEDTKMYI